MDQQTGSAAIETHFEEQGYSNLKLAQHWRHLVGTGEKDGTTYFLKMAATKLISSHTQNEALWYSVLPKLTDQTLSVKFPSVFETGSFEERFWYAATNLSAQPLAHTGEQAQLSDEEIRLLAQTANEFLQLSLPESITQAPYPPINREQILEKVLGWQKESGRDVSALIDYMQARMPDLLQSPAHGDFTPEHILKESETYYLIDLESARPDNIKYYDVAYCFHRLYTKHKQPGLAEKFLQEFLKLTQLSDQEKRCLELCLAQRLIGGYLDAKNDNLTSIDLQEEMEEKLINNNLNLSSLA